MCCKVFVRYVDTLFTPDAPQAPTSSGLLSPSGLAPEPSSFPLPEQPITANDGAVSPSPGQARNGPDAQPAPLDGIRLWAQVLQVLERLIKAAGAHDGLEEAIPESLKNIVMVMASDGYLVPPSGKEGEERTPHQKRLWKVTFVRLERFQPGLVDGIFPGVSEYGRETPKMQSPVQSGGELAGGGKVEEEERKGEVAEEEARRQRRSSEETVIVEKNES